MRHLSIRDLQKISGEAISSLPGPTAIKSGDRTVGMLIPFRRPNLERLKETLERARELAKQRNPAEDDAILREAGADLTDWSPEAFAAFKAEIESGS